MKTLIKISFILLAIIIATPIIAYLYFFTGGPRDLGVKYTALDAKNAYDKNGVQSQELTDNVDIKNSLQYQGQKEVDTSFTNAEITGMINSVKWTYKPITNVQIKINPDGTGEASGILHINNALAYISLTRSTVEVESAINKYNIGYNPSFYLKGKVSVVDNKVSLFPDKVEIGRIAIPQKLISENIINLQNFTQDQINFVPNLRIKSLTLDGGKVNLKATMPEKELSLQK